MTRCGRRTANDDLLGHQAGTVVQKFLPLQTDTGAIGRLEDITLAKRHGVVEKTIRNWLDRFEVGPIEQAPYDDPRPGRPRSSGTISANSCSNTSRTHRQRATVVVAGASGALVTQGRNKGIPKGKPPAARLGGTGRRSCSLRCAGCDSLAFARCAREDTAREVLASAVFVKHRESEIPKPTALVTQGNF